MQQWEPRNKKRRRKNLRRLRQGLYILASIFAVLLIIGVIRLISYKSDQREAEEEAEELREVYHATAEPSSELETESPQPTDEEYLHLEELESPQPTEDGVRETNEEIMRLQETNPDIIGWLTIEGMLDEPVVQRDNIFYLDHSVNGNQNVNGALFLDAIVDINQSKTLTIYGHNMRSGAMFGSLYKYDDPDYFFNHQTISFASDKGTEDFIVFAAGIISADQSDKTYVDFFDLNSNDAGKREEIIARLISSSSVRTDVTVSSSDQLLILVTCVDDAEDRRVVAAKKN